MPAVDLVENPTVIEVRLLHGAPVAEGFLDREEVDFREAVGVLGQDFRVTRTQVVGGSDFLVVVEYWILAIRKCLSENSVYYLSCATNTWSS